MLRPLLEYCSPVYDSMLTGKLINDIERQQKRALRIIYGFDKNYNELREASGLETLEDRRKNAVAAFTEKLVASERFAALFPENVPTQNRA